jgi:cyclophilin family peptidyl-prolyl cis-trans isomerase
MPRRVSTLSLAALLLGALASRLTAQSATPLLAVIQTSKGDIRVELFAGQTPRTVANFLQYVESGFYSDTIFHRVIEDRLIQGGGYTPELEEKPTADPIPNEAGNGLSNVRGTLAMARGPDKDSARAQFYINVSDNTEFDRSSHSAGYTVFGRVVEGMEVVDRISRVQTSRRGPFEDIPILPVIIDSIRRSEAGTP